MSAVNFVLVECADGSLLVVYPVMRPAACCARLVAMAVNRGGVTRCVACDAKDGKS